MRASAMMTAVLCGLFVCMSMLAAEPAAVTPVPSTPSAPAAETAYPLWDGKETVAEYARRAGIAETEKTLDLGNKVTMRFTLIPAGKFLMGSPKEEEGHKVSEEPQHEVTITKPFYMSVYECTQAQYEAITGANPSKHKGPDKPVETVSPDDALAFCEKLWGKAGKKVTLPTEARWEYACRAGTKTRYSFGDDVKQLPEYAVCNVSWNAGAMAVGQRKPNAWGLYDMHGNVWEWCSDWGEYNLVRYPSGSVSDPTGPASGSMRLCRGGCYCTTDLTLFRCAYRHREKPDLRFEKLGFRVALELE